MNPVAEDIVERLSKELAVSPLVATILVSRGLHTFDECERFFRPSSEQFHDPFAFADMRKAVGRITDALRKKEKIAVYGDYDVDGVTSTVLVLKVLEELGADAEYYLPNRLTEGYGVSVDGIDDLNGRGVKLVITVDCGITSFKALEHAAELGIDVVVTDHHEPSSSLPTATAILDPKVETSGYPDKGLAGVGVALKLCQALAQTTNSGDELWTKHLDIVALGTAADIVPLLGENRVITHLGYHSIARTERPGLKALVDRQGLTGKELSTRDVVFMLTPCINAAGRLGDPMRGVQLLLTKDDAQADLYARELCEANNERRALDKSVFEEARVLVEETVDPQSDYAIVLGDKNWHVGVIGIAASRIVEFCYRPVFLFSIDDDGIARGSGRSVPEVHLLKALEQCRDLLESFGGHAAAAGAGIREENIPAFRERFNEAVKEQVKLKSLVPTVRADAETDLTALTPRFYSILKRMAPFGPGNMHPVFVCRNLSNKYAPRVVGKNHLKLAVQNGTKMMDAIAFNLGDRLQDVKMADSFSLAFTLEENEWNGRVSLQMKVKGVEI